MGEKTEKRKLDILRILRAADKPLGSRKLMEHLHATGQDMSERTIRHYLMALDREGLTRSMGKRGRVISERGLDELATARVMEKVGFLSSKIDRMTYRMTFDLNSRRGTVITNVSILRREQLLANAPMFLRVYEEGYAMGTMMALLPSGEKFGEITIPEGMIGIATVCSITLNGVLLAHGIPTHSAFGGLLELEGKKPKRFTEIIAYSGTTLDPLEIFIRSGMTDYIGAITTGNGRIGVGFREIPAESRLTVIDLAKKLKAIGLGGFLTIGWPGQPLLEVPVNGGSVGVIVIGGLNPVAILEESGIRIQSRALAGFIDYADLFHYTEIYNRIKDLPG